MAGCKVIGLYGGAGSGKSEAARYLREKYGAYIIKADDIGHRLYRKNRPGYKAVVRLCGKKILDDNGQIDRSRLSQMLFTDNQLLMRVNECIHPMVYARTRQLVSDYSQKHKRGLVFFEAALLPDRPLDFIDENWYIHSDRSERSVRMYVTRNYSQEKISALISNQPSDAEYRLYCDTVIENNGTIKELEDNIDEALKYCKRQQR